MNLEFKIDNSLFDDLRMMIDRQMNYIVKNIDEEGFDSGEVNIKILLEGQSIEEMKSLKKPKINYKVQSTLKRSVSENNNLKFDDKYISKDGLGNYYLEDYESMQEDMFERIEVEE